MQRGRPILCLDFDGVIHSYSSGWKGADVIPDPPVAGALQFIRDAAMHFAVQIFSSRSNQPGGIDAMKRWLSEHDATATQEFREDILSLVSFPTEKPPALVTIDDRAITFDGTWPSLEALKEFKPWNKRTA